MVKNNDTIDSILEEYILISDDQKDTLKLYFNLNNRSKELKVPNGLLFGQLCGK